MPGAVARTSTFALTNSTLRYALELAGKGVKRAAEENPHLAEGVNTFDGKLTYRAVAEAIVGTIEPLTPTAPSSGDRTRPACRSDQWRLFHPGGLLLGDLAHRYVLIGGVAFRGGPPCHLRLTLRLEVLGLDGRRLPLPGNPSTTTVEGDLPEDRQVTRPNVNAFRPTPLNWSWGWQEWCNRDVPEGRMRVSAETGATITVPGPPSPSTPGEPDTGCRDRGRPSTVAPFP